MKNRNKGSAVGTVLALLALIILLGAAFFLGQRYQPEETASSNVEEFFEEAGDTVEDSLDEAGETLADSLRQDQKQDQTSYLEKMKGAYDDQKMKLAALRKKAAGMTEDSKKVLNEKIGVMEERMNDFKAAIDNYKNATTDSYDDVKGRLDRAWNELKTSSEEAQKTGELPSK